MVTGSYYVMYIYINVLYAISNSKNSSDFNTNNSNIKSSSK